MAVKVTIKNGDVESFDDENDEYQLRDNTLQVLNGKETLKIYTKGWWVAVEGKRKRLPYEDVLADLE